nr:hypothetical protein [Spirochaetota bacterium]
TLENAILAGADMMQGDGMQEALLQQNWEKTQYRAADWLSDWAAQQGRRDAEDWKSSQKKVSMEQRRTIFNNKLPANTF